MNGPLDRLALTFGRRLPSVVAVGVSASWWVVFAATLLCVGARGAYASLDQRLAGIVDHDWLPSEAELVPALFVFTVLQLLHFDLIRRRDRLLAAAGTLSGSRFSGPVDRG